MSSQNNLNKSLVLYFQVHQPIRLKTFNVFDVGAGHSYFNEVLNEKIIQRVAWDSYLPTNALLLKLIQKYPQLKITFSISGIALDQLEQHAPEVLESFKALAATGAVEFLSETYYHSLASLKESDEFETQVVMHAEKIYEHFRMRPVVFRNTELIYSNEIGKRVNNLGFRGIFAEGLERNLGKRSIHKLYKHPEVEDLKIFLRNFHLSDDIAFRFSKTLTAKKYLSWLEAMPASDDIVTIGMDYETFGEHRKPDGGIFKFLEELLTRLATHNQYKMVLPSEALHDRAPHDTLDVPHTTSWADEEKDLSAWLGNDMQHDAFEAVMKLEHDIKFIDDALLLKQWRYLQASDHFYYMSTKKSNDGIVHNYFSHYPSCYEAFINFMNVFTDFTQVIKMKMELAEQDRQHATSLEAERRKLTTPVWAMSMASHGYHP